MEKWRDFLRWNGGKIVEWKRKTCGEIRGKSGRCRQRLPSLWKLLHSPPQEISQRQKTHPGNLLRRRNFFPHGFSSLWKTMWKTEVFCGEAVESQDFQEIPFPQETPDRKSGEKKSVAEPFSHQAAPAERSWRDFRVVLHLFASHLACIFSEIFQENTRKSTKDFSRFSLSSPSEKSDGAICIRPDAKTDSQRGRGASKSLSADSEIPSRHALARGERDKKAIAFCGERTRPLPV